MQTHQGSFRPHQSSRRGCDCQTLWIYARSKAFGAVLAFCP
jgi:hypothetical protein